MDKSCVQCGPDFVFGAKGQKYWYESLTFHFDSVAIICPKCRKIRRSVKALTAQLDLAKGKLMKGHHSCDDGEEHAVPNTAH